MATFFTFLALALLVGACYFIYTRSIAVAEVRDDRDLQRFMIANRELHLQHIDHALWDDAIRIAHGDEEVAKARYIDLRVQQMKSEDDSRRVCRELPQE